MDGEHVVVRVPAFGTTVDPDVAARMRVRLVDRRSGEPKAHALLGLSGMATTCFEAIVPLWGMDLADVRVDVTDARSELAPAADDADEARRAVVFLAEWRRFVGMAQLGVPTPAARHLSRLAARLQPSRSRTEVPLFTGGPSSAELEALADLGDEEIGHRLRGDAPLAEGLRALTAGPASLLMAELAALLMVPAA